jgi:hypothetical protein
MDSTNQRPLGKQMLRTASLFQIGVALPVAVILGLICFFELFGPQMEFYSFTYVDANLATPKLTK